MKRIYLDQMKWIDLAAARKQQAKAVRYQDVLLLAEAGVDRGFLSFPLSTARYMETSHRRDWESREQLANTMATLSRMHTIAPRTVLVPPEIDRALRGVFGAPAIMRRRRPAGGGVKSLRSRLLTLCARRARVPGNLSLGSRWARDGRGSVEKLGQSS